MNEFLEKFEKFVLYFIVAIYAIFTFSFSSGSFIIPKEILLVVGASILLLLWAGKLIFGGKISFSVGRFDLGVILIATTFFVSTLLKTPNKMEAYLFPGVTTFVLVSVAFYFIINQFDKKTKSGISWAFLVSSLLLSLSLLFAELGLFSKIPQLPAFIKEGEFSPMGGNLPSIIYLASLLPLSIGLFLKERDFAKKAFVAVSGFVVVFALSLLVYKPMPGMPQSPKFVSFQNSWEVGIEAVKISPIWGVGPANYLTAFNLYRPVSYNATELWNVRFTTARNFYLTVLTEVGFAGIFALTILLVALYKALVKDIKEHLNTTSLLLMLIFFAIFPASALIMFPFFVLLSMFSRSEDKVIEIAVANTSSKIPAIIFAIPVVIGVSAVLFFGNKVVMAEYKFKTSLDALSKNDAKATYDLMREAITQNPKVDRYHASFAQVNMAIATSIGNKADITDIEKSTITQLVQQAIVEGKATVGTNPQRAGNWEVLARIYRSVMPYATGADKFAIESYTQAVALDSTNPNLRIALGGTYYALGRFDEAIEAFKLAVLAKPDLANAYYNLSAAYREKKDFDNAIIQMKTVLALVAKDSSDYTLAMTELENLERERPAKITDGTENLIPPLPVEKSTIKPPIQLPEGTNPPAQQ